MTRVSTLLLGAALTLGSSAIAAHAQTATPPPKNPANSATGTAGFTKPGTTEGGAAYVGPIISKWGKAVTPENAWRGYPRPQMARDTWMNLNGQWDYAIAPASAPQPTRSEEHTSELQSLMRISYAVFCLEQKKKE